MKRHSNSSSTGLGKHQACYSVDLTMRGFSFGIGGRSSVLSLQGRDTPSPFKYKPILSESPYKGVKLKGYSSDVHIIKRLKSLPGPGSYNPYEPLGSDAPKISIKSRFIRGVSNCFPAPNSYLPDYKKVLRNDPIYTISKSIRSKEIKHKIQVNPGPGTYNLPKVF